MQRPALAGLAAVAALAAVAGGARLWQGRHAEATELIAYIPATATTTIGVDVAALRGSGALDRIAGPRELESPEYRQFLAATRFDYRTDLDYAVAGLSAEGNYFALRGRFDWEALVRYAIASGGACLDGVCRLRTDSGKDASFTLASRNVLTISVGPGSRQTKRFPSPSGVAWAVLDDPPELFRGAQRVRLAVKAAPAGLIAHLAADCPDESARADLAMRLQGVLQRSRILEGQAHVAVRQNFLELRGRLDPGLLSSLGLSLAD